MEDIIFSEPWNEAGYTASWTSFSYNGKAASRNCAGCMHNLVTRLQDEKSAINPGQALSCFKAAAEADTREQCKEVVRLCSSDFPKASFSGKYSRGDTEKPGFVVIMYPEPGKEEETLNMLSQCSLKVMQHTRVTMQRPLI